MNKVAHYLQQHLVGEVLTSPDVLRYFSTDESIFEITPLLVVHPRNENDIRKTARFSWQLAERGRVVPITMKGKGTDLTGASLGRGIVVTTPAHMHKIIELDPKSGVVSAESGIIAGKLQQTLHTHGRFLPSLSSSLEYATLGGAVGNNEAGSTSYKYGPIREFVKAMRVVLANGELIRTERLSKRELNKKLGLASFEGEIYRSLDKLLEEAAETIDQLRDLSARSNVGYAIADVKKKDGSFDLTPLFVGSQGTLGLVTEATFDTEVHSPQGSLVVASFDNKKAAFEAVQEINEIKDGPQALDFIDKTLIEYTRNTNPNILKGTLDSAKPEIVLFAEVEQGSRAGKRLEKKLQKIFEKLDATDISQVKHEDKDAWMALRDTASHFIGESNGSAKAVPVIDDALVPVDKCAEFFSRAEEMLERYGLKKYAFWGMAGNGVIHAAPLFDISQVGDRQKMFKLMDEYYNVVAELGGSPAGEYGEGRLRGTQTHKLLSEDARRLMFDIKKVFDPFGILNPGVKVDVQTDELRQVLRSSYTLDHQYSHLPRS